MGWDSVVSTLTNAAQSAGGFGSGVVSGVKGGATSLIDGVVSLGSGALSAVKATGRAAIDPAYREQKMAEATDIARRVADYGGQLYDDPATRREAWDTVQSAVGSIKGQYVAARDAAAAQGQLAEFYGGLVGRGGFEVAGLLVPVTKLGALGKVGAAAEGAADLQKAAKVGEALNSTKAGSAVTACSEVAAALTNRLGAAFEEKRLLSAAEANAPFPKPPFKEGVAVTEGVFTSEARFVRLYDGENSTKAGGWMMPLQEIEGLTAAQIKDKFALPQIPMLATDVTVPAGTTFRFGEVGEIAGWGNGGGVQVQLMDRIPLSSFTNERRFP